MHRLRGHCVLRICLAALGLYLGSGLGVPTRDLATRGLDFGARVAAAQPAGPKPKANDEAKDKARDAFKQGAKAFEDKQYERALQLMQQAESFFHAPTHVLYIARSEAALKRLGKARAAYRTIVDEELPPGASQGFIDARKTAANELQELEARMPKITLLLSPKPLPKDVSVTMNGAPVSPEQLRQTFIVEPATYVFEAKSPTLEAGRVTVDAAERTTTEVRLALRPIGQRNDESGSSVVTNDSSWPVMKIASLPLMILGGGGLVAGGVLGALHFVRRQEADDKFESCGAPCESEITDLDNQGTTFGNVAIGALVGGAALVTTGIVLFVLAPNPASDAAPPPTVGLRLSPTFVSLELRGL